MTDATERMIAHLQNIAQRVADCAGDLTGIRSVIEDYSRLDVTTRAVEGRTIPSAEPAGEWVMAGNSRPERRLLYIHGGSWMSGSPEGYRPLAARIARATGYSVFVVDYRLAPENPFPIGLDDCTKAFSYIRDRGPRQASAAQKLVIAGDSAGGNLSLAATLKLADQGEALPDAVVALSPAVDLTWQSPSLETHAGVDPILRPDRLRLVSDAYVQGAERIDHPHVSPVFGDFTGLCKLLIQVGDREVLLDDAKRMARLAGGQGVSVDLQIYDGMPHVFQVFAPAVSTSTEAINNIGKFVAGLEGDDASLA